MRKNRSRQVHIYFVWAPGDSFPRYRTYHRNTARAYANRYGGYVTVG